jgi:phosphoglycerol transferase MdoB-like AlkP superfamily enzyme
MIAPLKLIIRNRFGLVALMTVLAVIFSLLTRIALMIKASADIDFTILNVGAIFFVGLFFDLVNASYFIIPLVVYLWVTPDKIFRKKWHRGVLYGMFFLFSFGLLFNAVSEWFFWDEFNTRFNFIAVDYLVYTGEVVGNIRQSYPIGTILTCLIVLSAGTVYFLRPYINLATESSIRFGHRTLWAVFLLVMPVISFFTITSRLHQFSTNAFVNELSGNGLYELFAAYRNNELDYDRFYQKIPTVDAFRTMHELLKTPDSEFTASDSFSIERKITNPGPEKKLNVVLISVESLSADFLGIFGNTQNITPELDKLAPLSLNFTNLYATGTRTVRGLEALSLCVPPTPGQSIVRRPNNEGLFSLGHVFREKGYETKFIYGGYGYFDNMGYFFSNNGYELVDRSAIKSSEIDYENIWGVADENLFTLASKEIDRTTRKGMPVFTHIMTTSNHRPYTYPDGRIDIPSHSNREGAVKYTDYAIGKFIRESQKKSWFRNTVFVIVADHCASSAGKTELPVNKYHIPMLIYSPGNIQPGKMDRLMSQIDLGPTLLGMLNFSYTSKFFGYDINRLEPGRERVFISTYQTLGFIQDTTFVVLAPQKKVNTLATDFQTGESTLQPNNDKAIHNAIAWYEAAAWSFKNGKMVAK